MWKHPSTPPSLPSSRREAARAAPLLGNQLHHADAGLNPGAILPETGLGRFAADVRNIPSRWNANQTIPSCC